MGGKVKAWGDHGEPVFAELISLPGNEVTLAARLASREPAEFILRASPLTEGLTSADRARDLDTGRLWDIKSWRPHPRKRGYVILTAESSGKPSA